MTHSELAVGVVVAAASDDEARERAWMRWYGQTPYDELEWLMREACSVEDTGEPAEGKHQAGALMNSVAIDNDVNAVRTDASRIDEHGAH